MANKDDQEGADRKVRQDRSVHVNQAGPIQVFSGDHTKATTNITGQQIISNQNFVESLRELKGIFATAQLASDERQAMDNALAEAGTEATTEEPDKGKIAHALEKAVVLAKGAGNAKELLDQLSPLVMQGAKWLGEAGNSLPGLFS